MIGTELLDDPRADPIAVGDELRDIARLNTLFGGTRAVVRALRPFFTEHGTRDGRRETGTAWTLLDVGTGYGDIPRAVAAEARRRGITLRLVGIELNRTAARIARDGGDGGDGDPLATILADGGALPLAPRSVDLVVASQVLHHLPREVGVAWIAALDRVARRAVVIADLHRSRVAIAGAWTAALGLGMSRVTRRDAVLSVRRGYTGQELSAMLADAGVDAQARYRAGFRVVAAWAPRG